MIEDAHAPFAPPLLWHKNNDFNGIWTCVHVMVVILFTDYNSSQLFVQILSIVQSISGVVCEGNGILETSLAIECSYVYMFPESISPFIVERA